MAERLRLGARGLAVDRARIGFARVDRPRLAGEAIADIVRLRQHAALGVGEGGQRLLRLAAPIASAQMMSTRRCRLLMSAIVAS